jgi:uncharacterized tellurite resistance protein B-like protein
MLGKLKNVLLGSSAYAETASNPEEREQLALASLLVEMARADFDAADAEHAAIISLLAEHFGLQEHEAVALVERAQESNEGAVCLFDFTRALHQALDAEQRLGVIRLLWQVALADATLDKYEDYLVRKVADLLYVPDSDVIRIKHQVLAASQGD